MGAIDQGALFFLCGAPGSVSTYVHVDDVVEALLLCAFEERAKNQIFNISNDCTQESLVEAMAGLQGVSPPFCASQKRWRE